MRPIGASLSPAALDSSSTTATGFLVDSIWALASPEVFAKLTRDRGWPVGHYEQWLVETAVAILGSYEVDVSRSRRSRTSP